MSTVIASQEHCAECINGFHIERNSEEDEVTLHVGMLADDGIVLVGDIWTYTDVSSRLSLELRKKSVFSAEARSKITIAQDGNMAISRAHDMNQAKRVSEAIATQLSREDWENPEKRLEEIAGLALASDRTWRGVHCLVALRYPSPSLFKVECGPDIERQENVCQCTRSAGYLLGGNCFNPATFFSTRYFLSEPPKAWTISELIPFAVQIIVDAGRINSGTIRGLEIVYCDNDGFHRLSDDKCRAWAIEARNRSDAIGNLIISPLPADEKLNSTETAIPPPSTDET